MTAYAKLLNKTHELCSPLSVESKDWDDHIVPALIDLYTVITTVDASTREFANFLRCFTEAVYAAGYQRGLKDSKLPEFVVWKEEE